MRGSGIDAGLPTNEKREIADIVFNAETAVCYQTVSLVGRLKVNSRLDLVVLASLKNLLRTAAKLPDAQDAENKLTGS